MRLEQIFWLKKFIQTIKTIKCCFILRIEIDIRSILKVNKELKNNSLMILIHFLISKSINPVYNILKWNRYIWKIYPNNNLESIQNIIIPIQSINKIMSIH